MNKLSKNTQKRQKTLLFGPQNGFPKVGYWHDWLILFVLMLNLIIMFNLHVSQKL